MASLRMKFCKKCETEKPTSEFYPCGRYIQSLCKPCHNNRRNDYYVKKGSYPKCDKKIMNEISQKLEGGGKLKAIAKAYNFKYTTVYYWAKTHRLDTETYKFKSKEYKKRSKK